MHNSRHAARPAVHLPRELIDRRGLYANLLQLQMGLDERSIGVLKQGRHPG